jgi:hypothetical protein
MRWPIALLLLMSCSRKKDAPLEVQVGAQRNTWNNCYIQHAKFLGQNWTIDISCDRDGKTEFNVFAMTAAPTLAEAVGKPLAVDFTADNPKMLSSDLIQTEFDLNGKHYQGHKFTLTIQSADGKEARGTLSGTYLEFAKAEDENPGTPVEVSFNFALPIKKVD